MARPTKEQSALITANILRHATKMFLEDGYDLTTMEAIASSVSIPKTTLYKRYKDKADILRAVLSSELENWSDIASKSDNELCDDLYIRLRHYTKMMFFWGTTERVRAILSLADVAVAEISCDSDYLGYKKMVDLVAKDIRFYSWHEQINACDPYRVARLLMAMVSGLLRHRGRNGPMSLAEADAEAKFVVDTLFNGRSAW